MKLRTTVIGILGLFSALCGSTARAQEPAPAAAPAPAPMPDPAKQVYAVGVTEPRPVPKQFAFTFNPLNLIIGRYGFNFEYQPVPHHGLIVTPHYDHNGDASNVASGDASNSLNGVGAELGYRFYSGTRGFNGFFAGPSLLIATHERTSRYGGVAYSSGDKTSSIGLAFDVGGQWQLGHFIIGGGAGVQYTTNNDTWGAMTGSLHDFLLKRNAGGGWLPRVAFNLGYAF